MEMYTMRHEMKRGFMFLCLYEAAVCVKRKQNGEKNQTKTADEQKTGKGA